MVEPRGLARMPLDELASWGGIVTPGSSNDQAVKTEFMRRQTVAAAATAIQVTR